LIDLSVESLDKIVLYATTNGTSTALTVQDYANAGITGVTSKDLSVINQAIAESDPADIDDASSLQALITRTLENNSNIDGGGGNGVTVSLKDKNRSSNIDDKVE